MKAARALLLAACVLLGARAAAYAQLPPDAHWRTVRSTHFRVTYEEGLEQVARHAGTAAERARAALSTLVADAPSGLIDIVVSDNIDLSNGYATAFPSNRIVIFAKPPVDELELQYTRDWVELVITHELAHIFHLDRSGAIGRLIRSVFGRVPIAWPVFSGYASPRWAIEGLAVGIESTVTDFGRVHGSYNEMVLRTAAIEAKLDDIDRLTSNSPVWPGPARAYIYGALFMDYLNRRFGADATARLVRHTSGAIIPPQLWFGRVARNTFGMSFRDAYEQWQAELRGRYAELARNLRAAGVTQTEALTSHEGAALYPRYSPDGARIAYAAADPRLPAHTRIIDARTGAILASDARTTLAPSAWSGEHGLLTTDVEFTDPYHLYSDIREVDGDRLTTGARLQEIDIARDRRTAVVVEIGGGTNRLVLVDLQSLQRRAITLLDPDTHWSAPRFSPRGDRIAVGRWRAGGDYEIVVLDTLGREQMSIDGGPGVDAAPAWSPDGRWIVFSSDRTGIANLYAADVTNTAPELRQVTNVLTGAFYPDISPDGRAIVFSAYHHDGYRIERIAFDPASWRAPMPAVLPELAASRGHHDVALTDSLAAAIADADTAIAPSSDYRPLPHLRPYYWLPVIEDDANKDRFFGFFTSGEDLVGRHAWNLSFSLDPSSGRTRGGVGYVFRGLPPLPLLDLQPAVSTALSRDWDAYLRPDSAGAPYIDQREDVAALGVTMRRARWRSVAGLTTSAELVRRSRSLHDAPARARLRDPADDLAGLRASLFYFRGYRPAYAISRENAITLQLGARRRWDRSPTTQTIDNRSVLFDASYDELTTWDAAYLALPLPGFARHVVAARVSALLRSGPGAPSTSIGGESGSGIAPLSIIGDVGGTGRFLPVRGFDEGIRRGTRAWTASAEYRLPIAFLTRSLRPLPVFLDRLAAAAFADAGDAWCATDAPRPSCASATEPTLLSAGAELISISTIYGFTTPVRLGFAVPLQGAVSRQVRLYLLFGPSF